MPSAPAILLVEDDPVDAELVGRVLRSRALGYCVESAVDVRSAQRLLASNAFDVIVADYRLPDGLGLELLDGFREVPLVLMTGDSDRSVALRAIRAGAYDFVVKDHEGKFAELIPATVTRVMKRCASEREARESQLALATARAENKRLEQFAHSVASALRVPLSAALHGSALMQGQELDRLTETYANLTSLNCRRALDLVNALREFVSATNLGGPSEAVSLAAVLRQATSAVAVQLEGAGVFVDAHELPRVMGCPLLLERVFEQLLRNVLEHAGARGGAPGATRVSVQGSVVGDTGTVTLSDNGPGWSVPAERSMLPFVHGPESTSSTGMGLAICQKIIRSIGGQLDVESLPEVGTRVVIKLPLAPHRPDAAPTRARQQSVQDLPPPSREAFE